MRYEGDDWIMVLISSMKIQIIWFFETRIRSSHKEGSMSKKGAFV